MGIKGNKRDYSVFACLVVLLISYSSWAYANKVPERYKFDIASGRLGEVLTDLSRQARTPLLYPYDLADSMGAKPVVGHYTVQEALDIMLSNTDFSGLVTAGGVITVSRAELKKEPKKMIGSISKKGFMATVSTLILAITANSQHVHAQDTTGEAASNSEELDVVVVTAQRREQAAVEVPISITTFNSAAIADYQIRGLEDYSRLAPNIGFTSAGRATNLAVSIRGISDLGGTVSPISVYVDEFNTTASGFNNALDPNLFDVERIEVLRGPQGTVFGRNVSAGAVSIITKMPDDEFGGSFIGEYGNFGQYLVRGAVNVPVSDKLAVRISAFTEGHDGFLDNIGPSGQSNDFEKSGVRGAVRFTPDGTWTIDAAVSYTDQEQGAFDGVPTGELSAFLSNLGLVVDPFGSYSEVGFYPQNEDTISTNEKTANTLEIALATLSLAKDFGDITAILSGGYMDVEESFFQDADYTAQSFNTFADIIDASTWGIEGRLQSNDNGAAVNWMFGAVYAKDEFSDLGRTDLLEGFIVDIFGLPSFLVPLRVEDALDTLEVTSYALFGDVTWDVSDRLTAGFGIRYSRDEVIESFQQNEIFDVIQGVPVPQSDPIVGEAKSETFTPRFSATYAVTENANVYGTISRGARPGGSNLEAAANPALPATYDEEIVWNYEVGTKGRAFSGALDFSISAFYLDWSDLQAASRVFTPEDITGTNLTTSAGSATSYGIEGQFTAFLGDRFTIDGAIGLIDATFDEFDTIDDFGNPFDASDNTVPFVSDVTASLAVQYEQPIYDDVDGFWRAEFAYRSSFFESALNEAAVLPEVEGYETVNLRAGINTGGLRITIFGENITNDNVNIGSQNGTGGLAGLLATVRPTRYGVTISFDF